MHQSIFERIRVSNDETVLVYLREEYQLLLHEDVRLATRRAKLGAVGTTRPVTERWNDAQQSWTNGGQCAVGERGLPRKGCWLVRLSPFRAC